MPYRAGKRLNLGRHPDGTPDWREPGDPVPEAADWKNLSHYTATGAVVADPTVPRQPPDRPAAATSPPPATSPTRDPGDGAPVPPRAPEPVAPSRPLAPSLGERVPQRESHRFPRRMPS